MARNYDMTIILVTHNAFRRDMRYLAAAADKLNVDDSRGRGRVRVGWNLLKAMLLAHHEGEDRHMWPRMHAGLRGRQDELAVLDAMREEHDRIDPLVRAVDEALARPNGAADRMPEAAAEFCAELDHHLTHEEQAALPLVQIAMSDPEWEKCLAEMRGSGLTALRAAPEFFPWLIGEADPADREAVLNRVPPPVRLLFQKVWLPRYARQPRWL
jgi:iron-sulfur cluster repair protein YtfE (RIC family)